MNFGHLLLLVMYHQQSFHLTMHQLLKSSSGSSFMQKISRHNYSIKMFIPLNGLCVSQKRGIQTAPCINTILPLLRDKFSTFNMQVHLMKLNMKWTAVLNPGQTQVCWYQWSACMRSYQRTPVSSPRNFFSIFSHLWTT